MEELVSQSVGQRRLSMLLLGLFATIALVLASIGIYGVMSYSVTQRAHEIGIRMALGAEPREVRRMVIRNSIAIVAVGLAIGVGGALLLTRVVRTLLYGVAPTDPAAFAGAFVLLLISALLASWLPARRATRVDPMVALRAE